MRDSRSPVPLSENVSKTMSGNKAKNSIPEKIDRNALRSAGYPGYRIHWNITGKPDIAYPSRKIAIFIHGCYWHRCPRCNLSLPKHNTTFWTEKFKKNIIRDIDKEKTLKQDGWTVFILWECDVKRSVVAAIEPIVKHLNKMR